MFYEIVGKTIYILGANCELSEVKNLYAYEAVVMILSPLSR